MLVVVGPRFIKDVIEVRKQGFSGVYEAFAIFDLLVYVLVTGLTIFQTILSLL